MEYSTDPKDQAEINDRESGISRHGFIRVGSYKCSVYSFVDEWSERVFVADWRDQWISSSESHSGYSSMRELKEDFRHAIHEEGKGYAEYLDFQARRRND